MSIDSCFRCGRNVDSDWDVECYDFKIDKETVCLCAYHQDIERERIIQEYRDFEDRCFVTQADKNFGEFINAITGETNGRTGQVN